MKSCYPLEIEFEYNQELHSITPVLLQDDNDTILIDCGYRGFINHLQDASARHRMSLHSLTKVIVTHHDIDHIGSLAALHRLYPDISVTAHEREAPYIDGSKKSLRLEQAESTYCSLPEEEKPYANQFIRSLQSVEAAPVHRTVTDGELLPWCGGIRIVATPGHTPGHISLYLPAEKTMIAGDAVVIEDGELNLANPRYTLHMDDAVRSVQRMLEYDICHLICYHGGLFKGNAKKALLRLLRDLQKKEG
ncbi:MBL fold metallo-hydrolase [Bacillus nakamurai]|uniref:MBL fold metallo-hydrolase n=1 Tax=Bacillus nakamurai TaxID=1793963 RepID=UPI0020C2ED41|nr:MBL fold metallo-hydrolase [Bacillus nakamurai]MCP6683939.1 MBL fold metallo-hydrolase [Bacillus nakamurai]